MSARTLRSIVVDVAARTPSMRADVVPADADPVITSVTHDSRRVGPGSMFVCVRGGSVDGHRFADDAVAAGASALLVDHRLPLRGGPAAQVIVPDTRMAMGPFAASALGHPGESMTLVGITGTNGKTTTAHALEAILRESGRRVAVIGTLTQKRTTPEATDLQERLAELRDEGVEVVVMEVTSHALELHRVLGLHFAVAVFTNLSQDHLDFHPTMEAYFRAKARLFTPGYADRAIVNGDDPRGALLAVSAQIPTETVSIADAHEMAMSGTGSAFVLRGQRVELRMAGAFNVMNALEAAAAARVLGVDDATIARGLANASVPGRYEPVDEGQPFGVVVDFAHTPDGLERVLQTSRSTVARGGRVICVYGCGGDRDRAKRPLMGGIGASLADVAIITSDNPRSEDPAAIADEMLAGVDDRSRVTVELDRVAAIRRAIAQARPGDVVVIAGKGHEQGQEAAGIVTPFDDRDVARSALRDRFPGAAS